MKSKQSNVTLYVVAYFHKLGSYLYVQLTIIIVIILFDHLIELYSKNH